jgi:hypothetical protein
LQQFEAPSLPLTSIRVDWTINARASARREVSLDYAEALRAGAKFPPVIIFFDGETYWLADGFHRYLAYEIAGIRDIPVEIRLGTPRAAALFSVMANRLHGVRPTRSDRRRALVRILEDPEWTRWSDQQIALLCGAPPDMVRDLRRERDRFIASHPDGDYSCSEPASAPPIL